MSAAVASAAAKATTRFKLIFFVPPTHLSQCKTAVFAAGAGRLGNYSECAYSTPGVGQFRPGAGSNPTIGEQGTTEEVGEVKCETVCAGEEVVRGAVEGLRRAHPYEEPAYEVYRMEDF
ncbi:MAG: hypothetical protein M1831_006393 [Alyxoria varia]|nr:MAG: hypothetical protein M1831_006393 [Alyxoria varia]